MATFEQNIMETIEKIISSLDTISKSIVELYGKVDELDKRVGSKVIDNYAMTHKLVKNQHTVTQHMIDIYTNIEGLTKRVEELERGIKTETCPVCEGDGCVEVEPGAFVDCHVCKGTGKINVMSNI